jgi:DNA mismatch repair ATPase MutS
MKNCRLGIAMIAVLVSESSTIDLTDSRHILQETFVNEAYVSNDFVSGGDAQTKIKIVTGKC